ncbi:MAG: ABC transporter permease [Acidobacteriota bacterium]
MDALRQDLRFALRLLWKSPWVTAIAVLSMALGIGVNTTAFSVLYAMLLRPLPYAEPERLVGLSMSHPQVQGAYGAWSYPDYRDLRRESRVFAGVAAHRGAGSLILAGPEGPERINIDAVSSDLFPLLGVDAILGRGFRPDEDRPGRPLVLLLSHDLWQRRFHGDPAVVGRTVIANGQPHRVVGVMPAGFRFPNIQEAWVPLGSRWALGPRTQRILQVEARLRRGASVESAQAEVSAFSRELARRHPDSNAGWTAKAEPLRARLAPPELTAPFSYMAGASGAVLLLACANVASLLLADAGGRRRELAIRVALGAGRGRIVRQLLTENVLLALAGGVLGLLLAAWGIVRVTQALMPVPYWMLFHLDGAVLLFALGTSVASGLLFGLVPAVQAAQIELRRTLKEGEGGRRRSANGQRLRSALVVGEIALALVLLIGASLFARSFFSLRNVDPGFASDGVTSLWTTLQGDAYATVADRGARAEDLARRISALPDVESAATGEVPLFGSSVQARIGFEGRTFRLGDEPAVLLSGVTSGYFRTLGIPLLRGRPYTDAEADRGEPVAVVNQAFAERFFPAGPAGAVGRRFRLTDAESSGWMRVVGVAADAKTDLWKPPQPQVYVSPRFEQLHTVILVVRSRLSPEELTQRVWKVLRAADPTLPVFNVQTMGEVLDTSLVVERTVTQGFALFGAVALFLASVGIYGVLSCSVSQRLRELGVRIALGARPRDVLALVLLRAMALAAAGVALGLAGALALTRLVDVALYQVSPTDPASFAAIPALLLAVSLGACWAPARRAMEADPIEAIRNG